MADTTLKVGNRKVEVSNLDKVLYPGNRFTKAQVIDYYSRVSPFLLPHFKNRPVTLVRFPNGVHGKSFYEKNAPGYLPSWIKTAPVPRADGGNINYILINDVPTLVWVTNLAALELHPFLHRAPQLDRPTHVVFDLDPGEGANVLDCGRVALLLKEIFSGLGLECFPKVSGSKGLQLYVPLNTAVTYDTTNSFAHAVADLMARQFPDQIVSDMSKSLRAGKIFIDWSQNVKTKTTVGVYSLRAKRETPFVSLPVEWKELQTAMEKKDAASLFFEPERALARLKKVGDLFEPVLTLKQKLPKSFVEALPVATKTKPAASQLAAYAAKRNFSKTDEPGPALPPRRSAQGSRRRFVIQKHAASHLHYDFRLEMGDTLKSWAIPKGLPTTHGDRRSAFQTEDHPIDYLDFEGTIPKGQYGGGTVMVWDIGTYDRIDGNVWKGELRFHLSGKKLKGEWILKRLGKKEEDDSERQTWLIIKAGPSLKPVSARQENRSAISGRSMEQIAGDRSSVWQSNRA